MSQLLYVEDDPEVRYSTTLILTLSGYTVKEAANGQQGLEVLAETDSIGIILTDFGMPEMNGYDFSNAVKTDPKYSRHSKVPIVGVGDFPVDMQKHLVACMPKPHNPAGLLAAVNKYCK